MAKNKSRKPTFSAKAFGDCENKGIFALTLISWTDTINNSTNNNNLNFSTFMWLCNSSIGRKVIMSVSGLALILFLTFHGCMNVVALFSKEAYNQICELLGSNWYAIVATCALAGLMAIHILYAFILTMQNKKARGNNKYAITEKPKMVEWASQNMLVLGIIVVLGLLLHLKDFWYNMMCINTLVTDIDPDIQVKNAMNRINAADREKTAAEFEAESSRIRIVAKAKAEAESKRLQGQGIADQRREIARGLVESVDVLNKVGINSQEASALIVVTQHYDTLQATGADTN